MIYLYYLISILIFLPFSLFNVGEYTFIAPNLIIIMVLCFLPAAFMNKSYFPIMFTKIIWILRIIFIFIFLASTFYMGMNFDRIGSFLYFLGITFFYELPFMVNIRIRSFFKTLNHIFIIYLIYSFIIIGYYALDVKQLVYIGEKVRYFLPMYPNAFAVQLLAHFWMRQFFLEKKSLIIDVSIIFLILVSLSRTAMVALLITVFVYFILQKKYKWNYKIAMGLFVLTILTIMISFSLGQKEISPGATLERTIISRIGMWNVLWDTIKVHPILGYGFQGISKMNLYYWYISSYLSIKSAHNSFMELILKTGAIGIMSYLFFIYFYLREGFKKHLLILIIGCLFLVTSLFQNILTNAFLMFYMYFTIGAILLDLHKNKFTGIEKLK